MSTAASSPLGLSLPHFAAHLQVQNGQVAAPAGRGRPRASQTGKAKGKTLYYCVALPRRTLEQEKVESSRVQELVRYIPNKEDPNIMEVLRLRLWATETVLRTIESTMGVRFIFKGYKLRNAEMQADESETSQPERVFFYYTCSQSQQARPSNSKEQYCSGTLRISLPLPRNSVATELHERTPQLASHDERPMETDVSIARIRLTHLTQHGPASRSQRPNNPSRPLSARRVLQSSLNGEHAAQYEPMDRSACIRETKEMLQSLLAADFGDKDADAMRGIWSSVKRLRDDLETENAGEPDSQRKRRRKA